MPGIPPDGTPEAVAFWASFWPALYSGFGYSIFTGLVVGLVIVSYQRAMERRLARASFAREVSLMRQHLREAVSRPDTFVISSAEASIPPRAEAVMTVIRDLPISLWRDELVGQKTLLNAVHDLQLSHSAFRVAALHLDHLLGQFARRFNATRGAISANDQAAVSYILGSLQGFKSPDILPWIDGGIRKEPGWLEEARVTAAGDAAMVAAHGEYAKARQDLGKL